MLYVVKRDVLYLVESLSQSILEIEVENIKEKHRMNQSRQGFFT